MLDHDVLGLDVPVDDALVVHVFEGSDDLLAVVGCLLLCKFDLSPEVPEQALGTVLEDEVDIFVVVEDPVEFEDVRVVHVRLEFYLPEDLVHHVGLLYLRFAHHLQRV